MDHRKATKPNILKKDMILSFLSMNEFVLKQHNIPNINIIIDTIINIFLDLFFIFIPSSLLRLIIKNSMR